MGTKYYHKNSNIVAFEKITYSTGLIYEKTYDDKGNQLTYKDSNGYFKIKGEKVTEQEFETFTNKPYEGKVVVIDGVNYELLKK